MNYNDIDPTHLKIPQESQRVKASTATPSMMKHGEICSRSHPLPVGHISLFFPIKHGCNLVL